MLDVLGCSSAALTSAGCTPDRHTYISHLPPSTPASVSLSLCLSSLVSVVCVLCVSVLEKMILGGTNYVKNKKHHSKPSRNASMTDRLSRAFRSGEQQQAGLFKSRSKTDTRVYVSALCESQSKRCQASYALKRSFEVEEADSPTNPSPISRRTANPLRSSTSSTSRFHDLGSRNSDYTSRQGSESLSSSSRHGSESSSSGQRSPKSSLRRAEITGARLPEAASRRTEISIDISSKQVDSSPSPGIARFGLRRPEVSLQGRTPELASHRRTEVTLGRSQDAPSSLRRVDGPTPPSRIPEPAQKKTELPSPVDASPMTRRPENLAVRQTETPSPARESENSFISATSVTPSFTEYKTPPPAQDNTSRAPETPLPDKPSDWSSQPLDSA
ncbi:hypothetical protein NFI96_001955 [Prochilodus magdalenae]|nr:hypothetical protein NFI96_001955 [Prochilodus magdalenae]